MPCPVGTNITRAAALLREGGLVAFPTETVYGLGANAFDSQAVARLFDVKNRPRFDPLIVHVAGTDWLDRVTVHVPSKARILAETFWPGPLSLVLPKSESVPDLVTAGLPTVAVRVPDHTSALQLLRAVNLPVAAPSANVFGRLSPTRADHVAEQLGSRIDYILDGGPCRVGIESTVLLITDQERRLLRPGGLPVEDLEAVVGPVTVPSGPSPSQISIAPGQLPRHYSPQTPLIVVEDLKESAVSQVLLHCPPSEGKGAREGKRRLGLLALQPVPGMERFAAVEILSPTGDLVEAAVHFFAALRRLDAAQLDLIIALPCPETGLGRALNDRLRRAAGQNA